RLERASLEVFHGGDAEPLREYRLRELAPEAWPSFCARLHPAAQLLDVDWPIHQVADAIKEGRPWEAPTPSSATILVWREDGQVRFRALEPGERGGLKAAARPTDFATICAALAHDLDSTAAVDLAEIINRILTDWLRAGLLTTETA